MNVVYTGVYVFDNKILLVLRFLYIPVIEIGNVSEYDLVWTKQLL